MKELAVLSSGMSLRVNASNTVCKPEVLTDPSLCFTAYKVIYIELLRRVGLKVSDILFNAILVIVLKKLLKFGTFERSPEKCRHSWTARSTKCNVIVKDVETT